VTDKTSLFDYASGTSTATFTSRGGPEIRAVRHSANHAGEAPQPAVAQRLSREIVDKIRNADCVFDVTVTGNPGFVKNLSAQSADSRRLDHDHRERTTGIPRSPKIR